MSSLVAAGEQADILASLRRLKGSATVGDVVADSGLPADSVRAGLKALLEGAFSVLEVTVLTLLLLKVALEAGALSLRLLHRLFRFSRGALCLLNLLIFELEFSAE